MSGSTRPPADVGGPAASSKPTANGRGAWSRRRRITTIALTVGVGMFAALNIHELGHTAVAWLAGDHNASYELRCAPAGFGCNHFDATGMGTMAKAAVTCGGCFVTQVIAWSLFLLRRRVSHRWRPVLTPLVAVFAVDLLLQFIQAVFTPLPEYDLTKVDFTALATLLGWSQSLSLVIFIGGAVAYVGLWAALSPMPHGSAHPPRPPRSR